MKKFFENIKSFFSNEENYIIMFMTTFLSITLMIVAQLFSGSLMLLPVVAFAASLGSMIMVELKDKAWGGKFNYSNLIAGLLPSLFFVILFGVLLLFM